MTSILTRFILLLCAFALAIPAQSRINDKDLSKLMKNLRDDAKSFRDPFKSAIKKSTIRGTSQAKDANNLADRFAKQTDGLLRNFEHTKKGDQALVVVQESGSRLDALVHSYANGPKILERWDKIAEELRQVSSAYGADPVSLR